MNAIAARDFERARSAARAAEAQVMRGRGPGAASHGLPLGVKDLQDTAGLLTTYGPRLRGNVPAADTALVARLRRAGAIVTAKTNVPDMAGQHAQPGLGATGNPFDPTLNAGGSSGGSAVALATGMLPLCTGPIKPRLAADSRGHVRCCWPRPSPGLVANHSRPLGWSAISVLGSMGRTVEDTALLMAASVGAHPMIPQRPRARGEPSICAGGGSERSAHRLHRRLRRVRAVDASIRRTFRQRITALGDHVLSCTPLVLPMEDPHRAFDVLRAESFLAVFAERAPQTLGPNVRANVEMAASISLADRAWAHLEQTRIARTFQRAFEQVDLIVAPVTPVSPFPWTHLFAETVDGQLMRNYYLVVVAHLRGHAGDQSGAFAAVWRRRARHAVRSAAHRAIACGRPAAGHRTCNRTRVRVRRRLRPSAAVDASAAHTPAGAAQHRHRPAVVSVRPTRRPAGRDAHGSARRTLAVRDRHCRV